MYFFNQTEFKKYFSLNRWNGDTTVKGPFPIKYASIERTLRNLRKEKYSKSPTTCAEIIEMFANPNILKDLGT